MKLLNQIKKFFTKLLNKLTSPLPLGMTAFDNWANSIISTYDLPDNDSTRFALATMILHLESSKSRISKDHIAKLMHKSMSNQVAGGVMQDLKQKQAERIKAEEEAFKTSQEPAGEA